MYTGRLLERRRIAWLVALLVLLTGARLARRADHAPPGPSRVVREAVPRVRDFALKDVNNQSHTPWDWVGRKAVVLYVENEVDFTSDGTEKRLEGLGRGAESLGAAFQVVLDGKVSPESTAIAAPARLKPWYDAGHVLAGQLALTRLPALVVLDSNLRVRYSRELSAHSPGSSDITPLLAALGAVLDGSAPEPTAMPVATAPRGPPAAAENDDEPITFTRHVAPVLWRRCAGCHRPGEVGPFPLLTYRDAAKRADDIRDITSTRRMPPWKAEPRAGDFLDDPTLSDRELAVLARWAGRGAPEGDPADLPEPPHFPPDGWRLGVPDLVLTTPSPFAVHASGDDVYRAYVLPMPTDRDRPVVAFEFRPGNRRVVHHAKLFLDPTGDARRRDEADPQPGFASMGSADLGRPALWEWTPGSEARFPPPGVGQVIPAGSDLVLFVHYHPDGKAETDQSAVGLHLSQTPLRQALASVPLGTSNIDIPAGAGRHEVTLTATLPADLRVLAAMPHAHYLLRTMDLNATLPDGSVMPLLKIGDWDFNWQGRYHYARPVPLPKGTFLKLSAVYDNSAGNPSNPNSPPKRVRFGPTSFDEMLGCHLQVIPDRPEGYEAIRQRWKAGF